MLNTKPLKLFIAIFLSTQFLTTKPIFITLIDLAINMAKTVSKLKKRKLTKKEETKAIVYFELYSCKCLPWLLPRNKVFYYACQRNNSRLASRLLDIGVKVDTINRKTGKTPLIWAIENNNKLFAQKLIKSGARVNSERINPLTHACFFNRTEIALTLIKNKALVNSKKYEGSLTPLHMACIHENKKLIRLLKSRGANVNSKDRNGETPLSIVRKSQNIELLALLIDDPQEGIHRYLSSKPLLGSIESTNSLDSAVSTESSDSVSSLDPTGSSDSVALQIPIPYEIKDYREFPRVVLGPPRRIAIPKKHSLPKHRCRHFRNDFLDIEPELDLDPDLYQIAGKYLDQD